MKDAVKSIIVSKDDGTPVFTYQGYALSYIDDFVVWKDYLVFATGNGLYVAKPGTNTLRCIMCEPDLLCYAFLPVGEQAYLGTSRGLYRMGAEQFTKVAL